MLKRIKHLRHPIAGLLALEYSSFSIEGRPDLTMVVYSPATPSDKEKIRNLLASNLIPLESNLVAQDQLINQG